MIERLLEYLPPFFGALAGTYFSRKEGTKLTHNAIKLITGTAAAVYVSPLASSWIDKDGEYMQGVSFLTGAFAMWFVEQILSKNIIELVKAARGK